MNDHNLLTVRVPTELKTKIDDLAEEQGVPTEQLVTYLLAKSIFSVEYEQIVARYRRGRSDEEILEAFDAIMAKVPDGDIPDWDRLPED